MKIIRIRQPGFVDTYLRDAKTEKSLVQFQGLDSETASGLLMSSLDSHDPNIYVVAGFVEESVNAFVIAYATPQVDFVTLWQVWVRSETDATVLTKLINFIKKWLDTVGKKVIRVFNLDKAYDVKLLESAGFKSVGQIYDFRDSFEDEVLYTDPVVETAVDPTDKQPDEAGKSIGDVPLEEEQPKQTPEGVILKSVRPGTVS